MLSSSPKRLGSGPVMSYPKLTELTRNPPSTRLSYEKNWVMFSPTPSSTYLQYELSPFKQTIAQLIGAGYTTTNKTDALEDPCPHDPTPVEISRDRFMANASWHQATPSLKLILCNYANLTCHAGPQNIVFFAAIHRKHKNY